jgi:GR25 family glycosyltransferase involved in LPS biosynthesis
MNLTKPFRTASQILHYLLLNLRRRLPRRQSDAFVSDDSVRSGVSQIYVINLDRQPERWAEVLSEFGRVLDSDGIPLTERTKRYSAIDAEGASDHIVELRDVDPFYTLADQLYVEPQPHALPDEFDLARPVRMSPAEIAIASSHISVWRDIARSAASYALVVEDDVWLERNFARVIDQAWQEMKYADQAEPAFDVLYLSYAEARHGAPKELISSSLFRPERGLWYLSGYVLSKKGAQALLNLLPCRGPIDLWINQKFQEIDVRALRRPVIHQRADLLSTNSYSILVEPRARWDGISAITTERLASGSRMVFGDDLSDIRSARWLLRSDTFPGNLGLFRPANVSARSEGGASLTVRRESLGVRDFSAAAISSRDSFLYGRFEATLQATNVSGLVTGFFLYRASPRQEIDFEIAGSRPTCLLINVFYNPGSEGAKFDYGYRGTPVAISLGFDASKALHRYTIEWDPCEIRWLVDGYLVHRRGIWNPTPIPDLPMTLHANTWPSRSQEFAGRLAVGKLPGSASIRDITVDAVKVDI